MGQREVTTQPLETSKGYREQANQDKRKPNNHPVFEHGVGEVICQPVENPHTPIMGFIVSICVSLYVWFRRAQFITKPVDFDLLKAQLRELPNAD